MGKRFINKDADLISNKNFINKDIEINCVFERDGTVSDVYKATPEKVFHPPNKVIKNSFSPKMVKHLKISDTPGKPFEGWKINVASWSDVDKNTYMCWGDHWVKVLIEQELHKLGCITDVELDQADVTIYLFGSPFNFRKKKPYHYNPVSFNVLWFYSHPEKLTKQEASRYDYIFCLSKPYLDIIKKNKLHPFIHQEPVYSCTNFRQPEGLEYGEDNNIVMVANARGAGAPYGREVVKFLKPLSGYIENSGMEVNVWGHKWDNFEKYTEFPISWFVAKYYDYEKLPILYRKARAVIIDGHPEMEVHGFVPMKLYDVFASGGLPIIKKNASTEELFGDWVLQYHDEKSLKDCLEVLDDTEKCLEIIEKGKAIATKNTFGNRVAQMMQPISEILVDDGNVKIPVIEEPPKQNSRIEWI